MFLFKLLLLPFRLLGVLGRLLGRCMGVGYWPKVTSGEEYEEYVASYLKRHGYSRIAHTGRTGDLGVDLVARKGGHRWAVQCKFYSGSVGGGAVQEVVAGMPIYDCDRALIVTSSSLTRGAWRLARSNDVEVLERITPENDVNLFSPQRLVTPANLVAFAVGCVLSGVVFERCLPLSELGVSGGVLVGGLCLFTAWSGVQLLRFGWSLLWH